MKTGRRFFQRRIWSPSVNSCFFNNGGSHVRTKLGTLTSPKFNIAPEKWWLEDYFPFGKGTFQGRRERNSSGASCDNFRWVGMKSSIFLRKLRSYNQVLQIYGVFARVCEMQPSCVCPSCAQIFFLDRQLMDLFEEGGFVRWRMSKQKHFKVVATQIFFIFTPKIGEDEPNLTSIFFRWVGSTTNQFLKVVFWVGRMINDDVASVLGDEVVDEGAWMGFDCQLDSVWIGFSSSKQLGWWLAKSWSSCILAGKPAPSFLDKVNPRSFNFEAISKSYNVGSF